MPLYNHVCGLWKFSGSSDTRNCWEALGMLRLWTDHCTVDNESLPIWIICLKHSKTIEVIFRGDILKFSFLRICRFNLSQLCFYMSVSHACKVKYGSSHPIQIIFGSLMRLTIVYVCAKFHKNRFNSKNVMTDPIRVGGTSLGVAIMPGLGGQTVVGGLSIVLKCEHLRCLHGKIWKFSFDSDQIWQSYASNHCLCVCQIS